MSASLAEKIVAEALRDIARASDRLVSGLQRHTDAGIRRHKELDKRLAAIGDQIAGAIADAGEAIATALMPPPYDPQRDPWRTDDQAWPWCEECRSYHHPDPAVCEHMRQTRALLHRKQNEATAHLWPPAPASPAEAATETAPEATRDWSIGIDGREFYVLDALTAEEAISRFAGLLHAVPLPTSDEEAAWEADTSAEEPLIAAVDERDQRHGATAYMLGAAELFSPEELERLDDERREREAGRDGE